MNSEYLILKTGSEKSPMSHEFKLLRGLLTSNLVDFICIDILEWGPSLLPPSQLTHLNGVM